MKLVSYRARGKERFGVVSPDGVGIIDVSARIEGAETLRDVLAQDRLKEVRDVTSGAGPDDALDDVVLALPIRAPQKILCAGRNYRAYHEVAERRQMPEYPSIFGRFASSFSAHRQAILKPKAGDELDYEGELVVVMGKAGRHVWCLRCLLLVMCTHPFAKKALTLHLARSEGHEGVVAPLWLRAKSASCAG